MKTNSTTTRCQLILHKKEGMTLVKVNYVHDNHDNRCVGVNSKQYYA